METILSSKGAALDRYYPLAVDGKQVVIPNLYANEASQAQIIVLEHSTFSWDSYDENNEDYHLAPNWSISAIGEKSINDSLFQADPTGNSRTVIGGMDMDMDGKKEVIATDYVGGRVIVYEIDMANNAFDVVWSSPVVEARNHAYNPRTVNVGDLDGDGKHEIVFPSSNVDAEGYHIYEWDGVEGSDNYGTLPSSICAVEVEICCGIDGAAFRGDHERLTIFDIDGDGQQELITAIRRGSPRGALVVSLTQGDDLVHNSNGGLETWVTEFQTNGNDYSGGSPLHALPADLNGDGNYEVVNHHWNNFAFYNFSATGPDTYVIADSGAADSYHKATSNDQYSIWGGYAYDVDGDGNDEAYYSSYGKQVGWSFVGTGDLYVVDYDTDEDVTSIGPDQVHLVGNAGRWAGDIGSGYDGHDNPYIFSSRGRPNITAMEYIGPDPSLGSSYLEKVIYWGELDVADTKTTTDETGAVTVKETKRWGFPSKVQTRWGDEMLDFDGDNKKEILMSFQNVQDSLTNTSYTWNATTAQYDTLVERVVSPKSWTFLMLENGSESLGIKDPITFIAPEDYRLEQNYPNPFNPNTMIRYTVPIDRKVSVKIYNVNGQLVNTLINNKLVSAGTHEVMWHGNNKNGLKVSTGMYFYSLEWAGMKKVKRMTLLK
jgi:flagellar hook assembly protein FlgD